MEKFLEQEDMVLDIKFKISELSLIENALELFIKHEAAYKRYNWLTDFVQSDILKLQRKVNMLIEG